MVHLRDGATPIDVGTGPVPLGPDELLLARDVLDTQIVDTAGRRVQRVGDVLLVRLPDSHLEVVAVDVGIGGCCAEDTPNNELVPLKVMRLR